MSREKTTEKTSQSIDEYEKRMQAEAEKAAREFAKEYEERLRNIKICWTEDHTNALNRLLDEIAKKPALQTSDPEQDEREMARIIPSFWCGDWGTLFLGCLQVMECFSVEWANVLTDKGNQTSLFHGQELTDKQREAWANYYEMEPEERGLYFLWAASYVLWLQDAAAEASARTATETLIEEIRAAYPWTEKHEALYSALNIETAAQTNEAIQQAVAALKENKKELARMWQGAETYINSGLEEEKTGMRLLTARELVERAAQEWGRQAVEAKITDRAFAPQNLPDSFPMPTDSITKAIEKDTWKNGAIRKVAANAKRGINNSVMLMGQKDGQVINITERHIALMACIAEARQEGGGTADIGLDEIYRKFGRLSRSSKRISQTLKDEIDSMLVDLENTKLFADITGEVENTRGLKGKFGKHKKGNGRYILESPLLPCGRVYLADEDDTTVPTLAGIRISQEPPLMEYAKSKGQVKTIPIQAAASTSDAKAGAWRKELEGILTRACIDASQTNTQKNQKSRANQHYNERLIEPLLSECGFYAAYEEKSSAARGMALMRAYEQIERTLMQRVADGRLIADYQLLTKDGKKWKSNERKRGRGANRPYKLVLIPAGNTEKIN